ncbi:ATP-binding protein, partial [Actinomadura sp. BRA 177]|uniref:ATP-binding protein n=1 Tax=Actinomadura sp. BRA 177 TaxID=2745202 RepID=UPI0020CEE491
MRKSDGAFANVEGPACGRVVDPREEAGDPAAKHLGAVLRSMTEMRRARLCFDPSGGERIDTEGWTRVLTLGGATLHDVAISREVYSFEQRLSVALMYLVSRFARRLMHGLDRRLPKAICLDEEWAITSTPEGAKL